jgi:hypothetical protein
MSKIGLESSSSMKFTKLVVTIEREYNGQFKAYFEYISNETSFILNRSFINPTSMRREWGWHGLEHW